LAVINKFYLLCVIFSGSPDLTLKTCLVYKRVCGMEMYSHNYILTPVGYSRQRHTGSHSGPCVLWTRGWVGCTFGKRGLWMNKKSANNLNTVSVIVKRLHVFCAWSA